MNLGIVLKIANSKLVKDVFKYHSFMSKPNAFFEQNLNRYLFKLYFFTFWNAVFWFLFVLNQIPTVKNCRNLDRYKYTYSIVVIENRRKRWMVNLRCNMYKINFE